MRLIRDFLTFLVLVLAGAITLHAAYRVTRGGLPSPAERRPPDLRLVLTQEDLSAQDEGQQRAALRRIERELDRGADLPGRFAGLTEDESQALQANALLLGQLWVQDRAEEYHQAPEEYRPHYVDRLLDRIDRWREAQPLAQQMGGAEFGGSSGPLSQLNLAVVLPFLMVRVEGWIVTLPPERQDEVRTFLTAVQSRLFERELARAAQ